MQQRGQEGPVCRRELGLIAVRMRFEDADLVAKRQDFEASGAVADRQQPEHRESVGHAKVCQSQQRATRADVVFGTRVILG
jgi:hypothetical protein